MRHSVMYDLLKQLEKLSNRKPIKLERNIKLMISKINEYHDSTIQSLFRDFLTLIESKLAVIEEFKRFLPSPYVGLFDICCSIKIEIGSELFCLSKVIRN